MNGFIKNIKQEKSFNVILFLLISLIIPNYMKKYDQKRKLDKK